MLCHARSYDRHGQGKHFFNVRNPDFVSETVIPFNALMRKVYSIIRYSCKYVHTYCAFLQTRNTPLHTWYTDNEAMKLNVEAQQKFAQFKHLAVLT
jgi:hypothetical protein